MSVAREDLLAAAFVAAADTMADDFDMVAFLGVLSERCVDLLDVDAAGLMLADMSGALHATAASGQSAGLMELFKLQVVAGPGLDAYRTGAAILNADLHAYRERWSRFAEAARAVGFVVVHAFPLRLRATSVGAMNLFCARPGPLSEADTRIGQALADVATIGILARCTALRAELLTARLQGALDSRVVIEQAKGVLAERLRITVDQAFEQLRGFASTHGMQVSELADRLVRPGGGDDALLRTLGGGQMRSAPSPPPFP